MKKPYGWSNECRLDTLEVTGSNNILVFESPGEKATVHLKGGTIQKVVFKKPGVKPITITIEEAHHVEVGEENCKRDVYHYLKPGGPAPTMRLGITEHLGNGTWSSLPHHFELNTEPGFEEAFFYILKGETKMAIQVGKGVWYDNEEVDDAWQVKDHTFGTVPMGYHPVVGEPGVHVSYVWAYLALHKRWEKVK